MLDGCTEHQFLDRSQEGGGKEGAPALLLACSWAWGNLALVWTSVFSSVREEEYTAGHYEAPSAVGNVHCLVSDSILVSDTETEAQLRKDLQ